MIFCLNIIKNGFWSAIPFLACFIFISLSSLCADKLIRTGKFRRITIRKLFNGLGLSVPILTLIGLSFITCRQPYLGVVLLTIGIAFIGCSLGAGFYVNINEISGKYSGVVFLAFRTRSVRFQASFVRILHQS